MPEKGCNAVELSVIDEQSERSDRCAVGVKRQRRAKLSVRGKDAVNEPEMRDTYFSANASVNHRPNNMPAELGNQTPVKSGNANEKVGDIFESSDKKKMLDDMSPDELVKLDNDAFIENIANVLDEKNE